MIKILEEICGRLLTLKNGATDERFIAACNAYEIKYKKLLEDEYRNKMFDILDYKLKDLTDKL